MKIKLIKFISVLLFALLFVLPVATATEEKSRHSEFSEGDRDPPFVCKQVQDPNLSKKRNGFNATNLSSSPAREYEDATGEQNTLVVLVAFADQDTKTDTSELEEKARKALFGGEGTESASEYFKKVSQDKMSLKGEVLSGWRILKNSEEYGYGKGSFEVDHNAILKDTIVAIDDDVYLPDFTRIIIFMEGSWGYAMGSIGKWSGLESNDGVFDIGICWIEKDDIDNKDTLRHEILHTLGGLHSGSIYLKDNDACERLCSNQEITKADNATWPPLECSTEEYGDGLCVLGHGSGYPSAFIKYKLGWLNDDQILVITESTTATLIPRASSLAGIKMIIIKAKDGDGKSKTYLLEYFKRLDGFDSSNKNGSKVLVRFFNEEEELNDSGSILLLKKKETEEENYYVTLNLKEEPFCDTENGIEINFISESAGEEMAEENSYVELHITLSKKESPTPTPTLIPTPSSTLIPTLPPIPTPSLNPTLPPAPTPTPIPNKEMILEVRINEVKIGNNDTIVVSKGDWVRVRASVFGWYDEALMESLAADKITCQIKNGKGKVKYSEEKQNSYEGNFAFKAKRRGRFEVEVIAYKTGYQTASFQASFKVE